MGDAAGQESKAFKFLGFLKAAFVGAAFFFLGLAFGDVAEDAEDGRGPMQPQAGRGDLHGQGGEVRQQELHFPDGKGQVLVNGTGLGQGAPAQGVLQREPADDQAVQQARHERVPRADGVDQVDRRAGDGREPVGPGGHGAVRPPGHHGPRDAVALAQGHDQPVEVGGFDLLLFLAVHVAGKQVAGADQQRRGQQGPDQGPELTSGEGGGYGAMVHCSSWC